MLQKLAAFPMLFFSALFSITGISPMLTTISSSLTSSSVPSSLVTDYVYNTQPGLLKNITSFRIGLHIKQIRGVILLVADSHRQDYLLIRKEDTPGPIEIHLNKTVYKTTEHLNISSLCGCDYKCAEDSVFYLELRFLDRDSPQPFSLHCGQSKIEYIQTGDQSLEPRGDWLPRLDRNGGDRTVILVGNRGPYPSYVNCTSCREKTSMDGCLVLFQVTHKGQQPSSNATTSDLVFQSPDGGRSLKPHCRGNNSGCADLEWREGRPHCLSPTTTTTAITSSTTTVITEDHPTTTRRPPSKWQSQQPSRSPSQNVESNAYLNIVFVCTIVAILAILTGLILLVRRSLSQKMESLLKTQMDAQAPHRNSVESSLYDEA